jgi:hypothetical protein
VEAPIDEVDRGVHMATVTQDDLLNTYQLAPGAKADQF